MFNKLPSKQIIIITVCFIVIIIFAIFLTFRSKNQKGLNLKTDQPTSLVTDSIESPVLSVNNQEILYFDLSSNVFKQYVIATKVVSNLSDKAFTDVYSINWSSDRNNAIIVTSKTNTDQTFDVQKILFDFSTGTSKTMNIETMNNFVWSNWENKILYSATNLQDFNSEDIFSANADGTDIKKITQIKNYGAPLVLNWPNKETIKIFKPFFNPPESYLSETEQSSILLSFKLTTNKTTDEKIDKDIADISFSPNNDIFAINKLESDGTFRVKNQSGYHAIKSPMDSSKSLVWSNDNKFLISFVVNNTGTAVSIYKIDLTTYTSQKITDFNNTKKTKIEFVENGLIYNSGQLLFFTDQKTLYGIKVN